MKLTPTKYSPLFIALAVAIVATVQMYTPKAVVATLKSEAAQVSVQRMAVAPAANDHLIGNPATADGSFKDLHNPSIFINEADTYMNKGTSAVTIQVDTFNFYASKAGNPVTPLVVRVDGDNDFTVLAVGQSRSSYTVGANSVDFDTTTPLITLNPGDKIAIGFMDSNADGSGWGTGGNPIPAEANGTHHTGQDYLVNGVKQDPRLDQQEVWALSPATLIEAGQGFINGVDTPSVAEGQNILVTNQGKDLKEYNLLRTYHFSIEFSSNEVFKGATLYQDADFGGTSAVFSDGIHNLDSSPVGKNTASSLKVEDGFVAYLCTGVSYRPLKCKLYPPGEYGTLTGFNNNTGMIKVDQNDPARHGRWGNVEEISQRAIATAQMPDGTVLFWQGGGNSGVTNKEILRIDPKTLVVTNSGQPGNHDTFCPGPALMPNGDLMLAGGGLGTEEASSVFEWGSETWEREEDMAGGHYYGTSVAMADGQVFHALGSSQAINDYKDQLDNPEVWNGVSWSTLTGIDLSPLHANNAYYNSNFYPYLHLMPNSNLIHTGGVPTMHEIDPDKEEIYSLGVRAGNDTYRHWGNAIMIDEGLMLLSGGRSDLNESVKTTVLVDFNDELNITSNYAAPMNYDRAFHNMVQLPTGDVFVSGGNSNGKIFKDHGSVYATELWDRESDTWTEMAPLTVPRNYHSTSFLLPDGRIWQAGGDCNHCPFWHHHKNLQFYSPPYLFDDDGSLASRPEITQFPAGENGVKASRSFNVTVEGSGAADIQNFNIIKLSSTTHQVNTDVRRLSLEFSNVGNGQYQIEAHDNINVMTPGYWMLFAMNSDGVPSEAAIVHVSIQPGSVNPTPKEKPDTVGNPSSPLQGADGWHSNLVINESDTYTNDTGAALELRLVNFNFYASKSGGPVTPFIVKVNGDNDFTVKAIGTTRIPAETGPQQFSFTDLLSTITLAPNETIATGFIDAKPDGLTDGAETAIVARSVTGGTDEIFYVGNANGKIAELTVGQPPTLLQAQRDVGLRDYAFSISIIEFDPSETPTPTFTPTATSTSTPTAVPTTESTQTPAAPTATSTSTATAVPVGTQTPVATPPPGSTATPMPTPVNTPQPPTGGDLDQHIYLPVLSNP